MLLAVEAAACLHKAGAGAWWLSKHGPAVSGKFLCQKFACSVALFWLVVGADVLS